MTLADTHRAIHAVYRIESARFVAGLARMLRDVGLPTELHGELSQLELVAGALSLAAEHG